MNKTWRFFVPVFFLFFVLGISTPLAHATTANVTQMVITTAPQTIFAGAVSAKITVQTQNVSGVSEQLNTSGTTLTLSSSSPTGEFSSSAATWESVSTLRMNSGSANRSFYYKDSAPGTHTITVTADGQTWTAATQTVTVKDLITNNQGGFFQTIQDAVDGTTSGGTIVIPSGTYAESFIVNKSLTISGGTGTKPIINGHTGTNYIVKLDGVTDGATLDTLEVNGGGEARGANTFDYGVWVNSSGTSGAPVELKDLIVKNIWNTSANGVEIDISSYVLVHSSTLGSYTVSGGTINVASGNLDLLETLDGAVTLPSGTTDLALGDASLLDLSTGVNTTVDGELVISGATTTLASFTSGDLTNVDLSTAQTVGSTTVAIAQAVTLSSGTVGEPIILTNSLLSNVSVSIPDGTTILAPSGWTGTIQPPKTDTGSGSAPSGFSVGNSSIDVGAVGAVLLFDKPVIVTLTGVTGTVGYRPAGSTDWTKITNVCAGDYDNPAGAIFPGECTVTNGTDTKILTYHFTTFGDLDPAIPVIMPIDTVFRGSVDVTMDAVSGTNIHYTTDGTAPICSSPLYSDALTFNSPTVLSAVRCDGANVSAIATATFVLVSNSGSGGSSVVVVTPATPPTLETPTVTPATLATPATPARGKVLGVAITPETASHPRLTSSQVDSITALLTAFGVDDATVDGARVTLMK